MTPGELFTLELAVGNAAIETYEDVAELLRQAADCIGNGRETGTLRDANGNTVGRWQFHGESA